MARDPSKTEKATPKRRKKQRDEGNVPKSQEVIKTATIIAGLTMLYLYMGNIGMRVQDMARYILGHAVDIPLETTVDAHRMFTMTLYEVVMIVGPVILFLVFIAFISIRTQIGGLWTTKVFKFRWENFNIFKGVKRLIFSMQSFVRLFKSIAFALVIGYVPYLYIMAKKDEFLMLYYTNAASLAVFLLENAFWLVVYTLMPMLAIAIFDLWYTRWDYEENMKMTKDEVKDEHKQAEGNPEVKRKQKQKMFEMMSSRMMADVPRADVVITNPTHYAVAIMYDPNVANAPLVLAKGVDHVALKIREIATEHKVPIKENRALARALYEQVEVGQLIPEDLYKAVAGLLAEIWRMKGMKF